jgi:hypothetical protein
MAYDKGPNAIWIDGNDGSVYLLQLDATKQVISQTLQFAHPEQGANLVDGLAYDNNTNQVLVSFDGAVTIDTYDATSGAHMSSFPWGGNDCYNSGVAIGGDALYEGSNGCSMVWVIKYSTVNASYSGDPITNFSTTVAGDPNFRDEGLTCDPVTFAANGTEVMWSKEAYVPSRATAFEIPAGSCGFGGQPPGPTVVGGEILSTDMAALFVVGVFSNAMWVLPTLGGAIVALAFGIVRLRRQRP